MISINVDKFFFLQEIRVLQALQEINPNINIKPSDEIKVSYLKKFLGFTFNSGFSEGIYFSTLVNINHKKPCISISSIKKPLIFPKTIPIFLKNEWPENRIYKYSFSGLITEKRKKCIEAWLSFVYKIKVDLKYENKFWVLLKLVFLNFKIPLNFNRFYKELYVSSSSRGRRFPIKSWDADYYSILLNSKFVLCPSGDFIWTYRFFESILCGAIPIVEDSCDLYEGFIYYKMNSINVNYFWSQEIVEYNFNLCVNRITFSNDEIDILKKIFLSNTKYVF